MADKVTKNNIEASRHDYLVPSKRVPLSAGLGAALAEDGYGSLMDNYGNILIGHELIQNKRGDVRYYDLTDAQWRKLTRMIEPHATAADNQLRQDNTIPVLRNEESPLNVMLNELESAGAPSTPIIAKALRHKTIHK